MLRFIYQSHSFSFQRAVCTKPVFRPIIGFVK